LYIIFIHDKFAYLSQIAALVKQMYVYSVSLDAMMARKSVETKRSSIKTARYKRFRATTDSGSRYSRMRATSGTVYRRRSQRRRR
jgi:hypothetical protein